MVDEHRGFDYPELLPLLQENYAPQNPGALRDEGRDGATTGLPLSQEGAWIDGVALVD